MRLLMKYYLNILVNCLLLITTPALLAVPQVEAYPHIASEYFEELDANATELTFRSKRDELLKQRLQKIIPFTLDSLMGFLDEVESGDLEKYSDCQLKQMCKVLVFLARRGIVSNDEIEKATLENDIAELLTEFELWEEDFICDEDSFVMVPALYYGQSHIVNCKSPWKKFKKACGEKWTHVRRFCCKQKKKIIVAAAVVIAVTAVACATAAAGDVPVDPSDIIPDSSPEPSTPSINSQSDPTDFEYTPYDENGNFSDQSNRYVDNASEEHTFIPDRFDFTREERPQVYFPSYEPSTQIDNTLVENAFTQMIVDDRIAALETDVTHLIPNPDSSSFSSLGQGMRTLCSKVAHDLYDVVGGINLELGRVRDTISPYSSYLPFKLENPSPIDDDDVFSYEELAEEQNNSVHKVIDWVCSTKLAPQHTSEYKAQQSGGLTLGMLPPPSGPVVGSAGAGRVIAGEVAAAEMAAAAEIEAAAGRVLIAENGAFVNAASSRIAPTLASDTWGWKLGQDITNRTWWGHVPKWSTVRQRYWKNVAYKIKSDPNFRPKYNSPENIRRMERGLAPQQENLITGKLESMELHHTPPQRYGGRFDFIEVWPDEHALLDKHRYLGS